MLFVFKISIMKGTMLGQQHPESAVASLLGRTATGTKEETGYTENSSMYTWTRDNPARFITDYQARFCYSLKIFCECWIEEVIIGDTFLSVFLHSASWVHLPLPGRQAALPVAISRKIRYVRISSYFCAGY